MRAPSKTLEVSFGKMAQAKQDVEPLCRRLPSLCLIHKAEGVSEPAQGDRVSRGFACSASRLRMIVQHCKDRDLIMSENSYNSSVKFVAKLLHSVPSSQAKTETNDRGISRLPHAKNHQDRTFPIPLLPHSIRLHSPHLTSSTPEQIRPSKPKPIYSTQIPSPPFL